MGKSGPLERAELANQIQGFRIPDRWDASEKNKKNFTILKKCRSKLERLIFEMLYIRKKRPKLDIQADSIRAKLFV